MGKYTVSVTVLTNKYVKHKSTQKRCMAHSKPFILLCRFACMFNFIISSKKIFENLILLLLVKAFTRIIIHSQAMLKKHRIDSYYYQT